MKKLVIMFVIVMFHNICGCSGKEVDHEPVSAQSTSSDYSISEDSGVSDNNLAAEGSEKEMEIDVKNRAVIAKALDIDEDSRNIRFILSCLNTLEAGQIQSAESVEVDGKKAINLIAEDGTNYRIYLSGSGSVDSVINLDTNEWPIRSKR